MTGKSSRQREYQKRQQALGRCTTCGRPQCLTKRTKKLSGKCYKHYLLSLVAQARCYERRKEKEAKNDTT